ncbi:MAG: hypothetical protein KC503_15735 [Myxococcales bacterium]|nr:hypothetical protein [Myxococcales bacterium]
MRWRPQTLIIAAIALQACSTTSASTLDSRADTVDLGAPADLATDDGGDGPAGCAGCPRLVGVWGGYGTAPGQSSSRAASS